LVNTDEPDQVLLHAERRVLEIQTKLHRWASDDPHRRFDDLYNLVADPAFLLVAWDRVRGNKGARTAGVDGETAHYIEAERGLEGFLSELRDDLKARRFEPLPVRRRAIPKAGGRLRYLGVATIRDRVAQACLKLVLEPIFEADFLPCSYGFRPNRRAHDAVAEVHPFAAGSRAERRLTRPTGPGAGSSGGSWEGSAPDGGSGGPSRRGRFPFGGGRGVETTRATSTMPAVRW
jgi:RNA-directed DNA polymerase